MGGALIRGGALNRQNTVLQIEIVTFCKEQTKKFHSSVSQVFKNRKKCTGCVNYITDIVIYEH